MDNTRNYARVGIFVALGALVAGVLIFVIGSQRHMFENKLNFKTSFLDVGGLREGSPVRMGGIEVGAVTKVDFSSNAGDALVHVEFEVVKESAVRIRANSTAKIISKGLLGDKALEVTVGDPAQAAVAQNGEIKGDSTDEIGSALKNAGTMVSRAVEAVDKVKVVLDNVARATAPLANDQLGNEAIGAAKAVRLLAEAILKGDGTLGQLVMKDTMAKDIKAMLATVNDSLNNVKSITQQAQTLMHDARTGNGLVHALVYDTQAPRALRSLTDVSDQVAGIVRDIRNGPGGLHEVIYGDTATHALGNINDITASARDIMRDVRQGRGSLGALLVDNSLYEDLKSLVGNVQRNEILRAMVRYSIHANERGVEPSVGAHPPGAGTTTTIIPRSTPSGSGTSP